MYQLYLLSIACNVIAGLYLFLSPDNINSKNKDTEEKTKERPQLILPGLISLLSNKMAKFWLGSAAIIIGIFKMIGPMGDSIVILGDFLPMLSSMIIGCVFIIDFFKSSSEIASDTIKKLDTIVLKNRKYIGMFSLVVALLHFLVPGFIIL